LRVVRRVVPDVHEAVLQRLLRQRPLPDYTQRDGKQFRGARPVELGEGGPVAQRRAGDEGGEAPFLAGHGAVRSRPGFHIGSSRPEAAFSVRAAMKRKSERRLRYLMLRADTASARPSATSERSARRQTARARWQAAAARVPPGRTNSRSGGSG